MQTQSDTLPAMSDADFRIHWIAGLSAAAIAQTACRTLGDVHARAQHLGFITPLACAGRNEAAA